MPDVVLSPLRFVVDHRNPGPEGGPTLRVYQEGGDRELLRFDGFLVGGHWHVDPHGADEITPFEGEDAIDGSLRLVRGELPALLDRAGATLAGPLDAQALGAALDRVEALLRNPPADFDAVRPGDRKPSRGEKWALYPDDVLPVWVADMDFAVAEPIRRALLFAALRSDVGYPIHPAPTDVPEIVQARMQERFGWSIEPRRVEILTDVVQGMYVALSQFSAEGEGVVVQTPIYPPFLGSVRSMKRRLVENPLVLGDDGYRMDLDHLASVVDDGTRVILLCNPHNPSGRCFRRDELLGVAEIARRHDLVVVSDEIHADLVWSGHEHVPFASLSEDAAGRSLVLTAASKAFNIAGLRCGIAVFGSDAVKRRFNALPRHLRGGVGTLGIESLRAAWRHSQPWLDAARAYMEANRDFVTAFVRDELPGVGLHPPEATYLAWLDCRALGLQPSPYQHFLDKGRVALSDGASFGEAGRGFARINFATSRAILTEALERVAKSLR
ncbi:MAG: MalY/PatB family protein [Myxococcota bacterium]